MIKRTLISLFTITISFLTLYSAKLNFIENTNDITNISGVTHQTINGTSTNDNGTTGNQNINIFTQGEGIEVVSWSSQNRKTTLNMAKDFELNNPNFEVLAAINGDYFNMGGIKTQTTNGNVIYGNRSIKPQNHSKYMSVEFDLSGKFIKTHKTMKKDDDLTLTMFDKDNRLTDNFKISPMNKAVLNKGEISYITSSRHQYNSDNKYVEVLDEINHSDGSHTFIEGVIGTEVTDIKGKKVLAINSDTFKYGFNFGAGSKIIIQTEVLKSSFNSMMIGVGSQIIKDEIIPEFNQIGDQNEAFAKARHPRTGFGFNKEGKMMLFTVDGRKEGGAQGVNLREFGKIMGTYGVHNGFNMDGGASTQAVIKENGEFRYVNKPSDGPSLRAVANTLMFVKRKVDIKDFKIEIKEELLKSEVIIDLPKDENIILFSIIINEDEYKYNQDEITGSLTYKLIQNQTNTVGITALTKDEMGITQEILIHNQVYDLIEVVEKPPVENVDVEITHTIEKNVLTVSIKYDDPNKTIDRIRVYLTDPKEDKPAIVKNSETREAKFKLENKLKSQEIVVEVLYNDRTTKNIHYKLNVNQSGFTQLTLFVKTTIIVGSILIIMIIIFIPIMLLRRKR